MQEVDAEEYADWQAYYAIEPFGGHVEDVRAGVIASVVAGSVGKEVEPLEWFGWHERIAAMDRDAKLKKARMKLLGMGIDIGPQESRKEE